MLLFYWIHRFVLVTFIARIGCSIQPVTYSLPTTAATNNELNTAAVRKRVMDSKTEILDLWESGVYDWRWLPPRPDYDTPLDVFISMMIDNIFDVNATDMSFKLQFSFIQKWRDKRLTYKPFSGDTTKPITLTAGYARKIWVPDSFFANSKTSWNHTNTLPNNCIKVYTNGTIIYNMRVTVKTQCKMSLQYFPMDIQKCDLHIESYGYDAKSIKMLWDPFFNVTVEPNKDFTLTELHLLQMKAINVERSLSTGTYYGCKLEFVFGRDLMYFLVQNYIPAFIIVVLSWVSFWIIPDRGRASVAEVATSRAYIGVTGVLSMILVMNTSKTVLPNVDYLNAVDVYFFVSFVYVLAALLEFIVVHYLDKSKKKWNYSHQGQKGGRYTLMEAPGGSRHFRINSTTMSADVSERRRNSTPHFSFASTSQHACTCREIEKKAKSAVETSHEGCNNNNWHQREMQDSRAFKSKLAFVRTIFSQKKLGKQLDGARGSPLTQAFDCSHATSQSPSEPLDIVQSERLWNAGIIASSQVLPNTYRSAKDHRLNNSPTKSKQIRQPSLQQKSGLNVDKISNLCREDSRKIGDFAGIQLEPVDGSGEQMQPPVPGHPAVNWKDNFPPRLGELTVVIGPVPSSSPCGLNCQKPGCSLVSSCMDCNKSQVEGGSRNDVWNMHNAYPSSNFIEEPVHELRFGGLATTTTTSSSSPTGCPQRKRRVNEQIDSVGCPCEVNLERQVNLPLRNLLSSNDESMLTDKHRNLLDFGKKSSTGVQFNEMYKVDLGDGIKMRCRKGRLEGGRRCTECTASYKLPNSSDDSSEEGGAGEFSLLRVERSARERLTWKIMDCIVVGQIDYYSRIWFPLSYFLLNCVYWLVYLHLGANEIDFYE